MSLLELLIVLFLSSLILVVLYQGFSINLNLMRESIQRQTSRVSSIQWFALFEHDLAQAQKIVSETPTSLYLYIPITKQLHAYEILWYFHKGQLYKQTKIYRWKDLWSFFHEGEREAVETIEERYNITGLQTIDFRIERDLLQIRMEVRTPAGTFLWTKEYKIPSRANSH